MPTPSSPSEADTFGRAAQGFLATLLVTKAADPHSEILPFLYGHTLELAAKGAVAKKGPVPTNHNILLLLETLYSIIPELEALVPTTDEMSDYKDVWIDGHTSNQAVTLPAPTRLDRLEVAYFIDNVMDLKYLSRKSGHLVSALTVSTPGVNRHFMEIFVLLRKVFRTELLDDHLRQRLARFHADPAQRAYVESLVNCQVPLAVSVAGPRTLRNDPCPCGSAKKYKRCHG